MTEERARTGISHLLISGGEPQIQIPNIAALMTELAKMCSDSDSMWTYDIETTGQADWSLLEFFFPTIQFNLSPKIAALEPGRPNRPHIFFTKTVPNHRMRMLQWSLKVVVRSSQAENDIKIVQQFCIEHNIPRDKVYLMPFGIHRDQIIKESEFWIDYCLANNYQFSPRMHILLYDNKRLV